MAFLIKKYFHWKTKKRLIRTILEEDDQKKDILHFGFSPTSLCV
jgi:hypothetical protein